MLLHELALLDDALAILVCALYSVLVFAFLDRHQLQDLASMASISVADSTRREYQGLSHLEFVHCRVLFLS